MKKKTKVLLATIAGCTAAGCAAYLVYKNKDEIIELAEGVIAKLKNDDLADDFDDFDDFADESVLEKEDGGKEQYVPWNDIATESVDVAAVDAPTEDAVAEETPAEAIAVEDAAAEETPAEAQPAVEGA